MMLGCLAVNGSLEHEVGKTRCSTSTDVYDSLAVLEFHTTLGRGRHHVLCHLVIHFHVLSIAILEELHLYVSLLACLVEPVGMVRCCYPKKIITVGIVLYRHSCHDIEQHDCNNSYFFHINQNFFFFFFLVVSFAAAAFSASLAACFSAFIRAFSALRASFSAFLACFSANFFSYFSV